MERREFIKKTGTLVAGIVAESAFPKAPSPRPLPVASGRLVLPMSRNWLFSRSAIAEARARDFDDSKFEPVVIPHANIRVPWHSFDDKDYEFVSVYRRHFRLPREARGRHVFVDFEGVMTASTVWLNGTRLGEYKGGYTPFSFDLTPHLEFDGDNVLTVEVDSTERADIPPFGNQIDYLTFGGIYREVALRIVPATFIENIFAKTKDALTPKRSLEVECFLQRLEPSRDALSLEVTLRDGDRALATATQRVGPPAASDIPAPYSVRLESLGPIVLWDLAQPKLYSVHVRLLNGPNVVDEDSRTIGFREARFTKHGFELNGKVAKLRGLDRHQTFPFVGQAMPARVQRRDAQILRNNFKCNIVRTSHYPQSRHFLDACDEVGLLVLEEIPGWQHIGDAAWKDIYDSPRLEPSIDHSLGSPYQRIPRRSRVLHSHQCPGPSTRSNAANGRRPEFRELGTARGRVYRQRFRISAPSAQPSPVPQYGIHWPHVSDQELRQHGTTYGAHSAPRSRPQPACIESSIRRRHWMVCLRLQHAFRFRFRRPDLLPRRCRHLPRAQACRGFLQIAVRSRRRNCAGARLPLGTRR